MTILVTGATGLVGRNVVSGLLAAGRTVRALTRNPDAAALPGGVAVFQGDLADPPTLSAALDGADALYLFPVAETAKEVVDRAKRAGVRRVVVLSSDAMVTQLETNRLSVEEHGAVERAVEESGLTWTFLRPFGFAANTLFWASSIRAEGVVRAAYPRAAQALVHEADIADVAVAALLRDGHAGAKYRLSGPAAITQLEQARAIGEAIGRDIDFEELTPERKRQEMLHYIPPYDVDMILGYFEAATKTPDVPLPTVQQVLGRPARTFARWAADHAADFR